MGEAAKKKAEEAEAVKLAEEEKKKPKNVLAQSLKEAMGTDESRMRGSKSSTKKKDDKDEDAGEKKKILNGVDEGEVYKDFADGFGAKKAGKKETKAAAGTIEACREAEDDFM